MSSQEQITSGDFFGRLFGIALAAVFVPWVGIVEAGSSYNDGRQDASQQALQSSAPEERRGKGVMEQYKPWGRYSPPGSIVEESAILAGDVYTASKAVKKNGQWVIMEGKQEKPYDPPAGYTLKATRSGEHGFGAAVYENTKTGQRTVAIAGTGDFADALTDAEISARTHPKGGRSVAERVLDSQRQRLKEQGNLDSQVKQSLMFFEEAQNLPPTNPLQTSQIKVDQINVTGHSLGGGLAQIVGAMHQVETQTFNAVGMPSETVEKYVGPIRTSLPITNHIRSQDPVGNYGNHLGTTVTYPNANRGGERGLFATPSLSDLVGTGKAGYDNHSQAPFINDIREGAIGRLSTDRELERQRAQRAVQEPMSSPVKPIQPNSGGTQRSAQDLGFLAPKKQIMMSDPLCPKEY